MKKENEDNLDVKTKKSVKKATDNYNIEQIVIGIGAILVILFIIWELFIN